jgi:hypothetical protein
MAFDPEESAAYVQYSLRRNLFDLSPFFHPAMSRVTGWFEPNWEDGHEVWPQAQFGRRTKACRCRPLRQGATIPELAAEYEVGVGTIWRLSRQAQTEEQMIPSRHTVTRVTLCRQRLRNGRWWVLFSAAGG